MFGGERETAPDPEQAALRAETVRRAMALLDGLPPYWSGIVRRRLGVETGERTVDELGEEEGISRSRVSQIVGRALEKVRARISVPDAGEHRLAHGLPMRASERCVTRVGRSAPTAPLRVRLRPIGRCAAIPRN